MRRARILSRSPSSRFCRSQPTRQAVFHLKRTAKIKTSRNVDSFSRSPSRRKSRTLFTCGFSKQRWPSTQPEQIKAYISQSFAKPPSHVRQNIPKPPTLTHGQASMQEAAHGRIPNVRINARSRFNNLRCMNSTLHDDLPFFTTAWESHGAQATCRQTRKRAAPTCASRSAQ